MEQPSKEWVTHEAHRVFDEELKKAEYMFRAIVREEVDKLLHPHHAADLKLAADVSRRGYGRKFGNYKEGC